MKVIVAGSRHIEDADLVVTAIESSGFPVTQIVSGGAPGVDSIGEQYARWRKIQLMIFKADWNRYGRSAGPKRNRQMAEYADALVAIWDGKSRGTKNMIDEMKRLGKLVFITYPPGVR